MRTYLVVAHKTLVDAHLLDEVEQRAAAEPSTFHLLVPMAAPASGTWSYGQVAAAAERRLQEGLDAFRARGLTCGGEVGDGRPVDAVLGLLRGDVAVDEIIVSTLRPGPSRWLKWDVPSRLEAAVRPIPVHHVAPARLATPT